MSRRKYIKNTVKISIIKVKLRKLEHYAVNFIVVLLFLSLFLLFNSLTNFYVYYYEIEDIQTFKIDAKGLKELYETSNRINIEHEKLLAMYAKNNNYFSEDTIVDEFNGIGKNRLLENIKFIYFSLNRENKQVYGVLKSLDEDIKTLPIKNLDYVNVVAIDCFSIIKENYCTMFMEKEVTTKDIKVISATDGVVKSCGYNGVNGLEVVVETENGNKFVYGNLGEINNKVRLGSRINSGQTLGKMGNTEQIKDKVEFTRSKLSMYIIINQKYFGEEMYFNPYPILYLKSIKE